MTKINIWPQRPTTPPPSLAPAEAYSIPAGDILISRIPTVHRPPWGSSPSIPHTDRLSQTQNITMSQYYGAPPPNQGYAPEAQNLQFYQSSYTQPVSGHATPSQASYGYNAPPAAGGYGVSSGFNSGFGGAAGISGRMGEQGGLRTGWLAALSTEGYDGEPPLLEELGIKPANIRAKVLDVPYLPCPKLQLTPPPRLSPSSTPLGASTSISWMTVTSPALSSSFSCKPPASPRLLPPTPPSQPN